jgi:hypothetical protein
MAMTLVEFRQQYPQYDNKTDQELADALHRKFYSTIPREEFDARIGLLPPGNVASPSHAYTDALTDASARSQVFGAPQQPTATPAPEGWQPDPYFADLPVPGYPGTPGGQRGVSGPSDNIQITGLWENIGAGIDSGVNKILGAPVDLPVWLGNSLVNAANSGIEMSGNGRPIPNIPTDLPGSSEGWERTQGNLGFTTPSQVVPGDMGQQLARAATEAGTMAAIPELLMMRLGQAGATVLPPAMDATAEIAALLFGQSRTGGEFARNLAVNAAGGAGADAAMEAAPEWAKPYAALAGGLTAAGVTHGVTGIPGAAHNGAGVVADYLAPLTPSGQQRIAGQTIHDAAASPGGVLEALIETSPELVPGSAPTTFQMTGDMGLGALERGVAARNPAEFMQRSADQNAARIGAMEGIQPGGAPERIAASVRTYMDAIDQQVADTIAASTRRAQDAAQGMGPGIVPEMAGTTMREALESARASAKAQERALWQAVDPDSTMTLGTQNVRQGASQIARNMPASAKPMAGEEAAIFGVVRGYGDTVPFSELSALQSRLKAEMRAERIANGDSPAYARMSQLNSSIQQDLETAIAGKVQQEQQAVAAGTMTFEQTIAANIQKWRDDWQARQSQDAVGFDNSGSGVPSAGSGEARIGGLFGAEGQGSVGLRGASRNSGLSADAGTRFDQAALDRLNAARGATRQRVETFDNPTLGSIRRRPSTVSPYDMPSGAVPGRIFFPGPKSPEAIQRFRKAVGDEQAIPALTGYAVNRMRKAALTADGTIDPAKANAWLRQHADAMRSFPELAQSIKRAINSSEVMGAVARHQRQQLDDAQLGLVGRILGTNDPQEVVRIVGSTLARQDAATQIGKLHKAIGNDKEAQEGLRKAVADFITDRFIGNTEAGTSGLGTIRSDQFQTFVRQKRDALKAAGFTDNEFATIDAIAQDLQRANRSIASVRIPGGSNTVQDALVVRAGDNPATLLSKIVMAGGASGIGTSIALGPWIGVPAGIATALVGAWRQAGLQTVDDLVKEAMLNPALARHLLEKVPAKWEQQVGIDTGQAARRAIINALAASTPQDESNRHADIAQALMGSGNNWVPRPDPVAEALMRGPR